MRPERSIRSRLKLLVLGVALPLVLLAAYTIWTDFRSTLREARGQTDRIAEATASAAQQYVASAVTIANQIVQDPDVQSLDPERCTNTLTAIVAALPFVTNLAVTRTEGPVVCSVVPLTDPTDRDNSDRPWVRAAVASGTATISPPFIGRTSQTPLTSITIPIRGENDEIRGTLTVPLELRHLQEVVEQSLPEGGLLTITDTSFVVVARSEDPQEWVTKRLPSSSQGEEADISVLNGYNTAYGADGIERLFSYRSVPGTPWIVWAGVPTALIYRPVRAVLLPKLGLAALTIVLVLVFAATTNRRIQTSLSDLSEEMLTVERSDDGLLSESGPEEIAAVAERYNLLLHDRRRAEASAIASADLKDLVTQSTNDALWDWDLDADQIDCNPRFFELFGGEAQGAVKGMAFWAERIHPDDLHFIEERTVELLDPQLDHWTTEYRIRRPDGDWAEVFDRSYAVRDDHGKPLRYFGAMMDVTEIRSAQRATEVAKERYRSILHNAVFGVYIATAGGKLVEANPALLEILGTDKGTALKWSDRDFYVDPSDRDRAVGYVLSGGEAHQFEAQWRTPAGRTLEMRLFFSSFVDSDGDISIEVMAEDLTESKRLEEQFRQAQKMEAMGQLAGGVAHDFNNRLTVIQGRGELIRNAVMDDPDLLDSIDAILESAGSAAELTRGLLAVSRKQMYRPQVVSLNEVVERLHSMLNSLVGERFQLDTDLDTDLPPVTVDPGHIQQIIMNLTVNARDAQPHGGRIVLVTGTRRVTPKDAESVPGLRDGVYVVLSVVDEGSGMTPEVLERVFEPFFTTKPVGLGTGLGLATVYGLAKQNDSFVSIHSEVGSGTRVDLLMPQKGSDPISDEAAADTRIPRGMGARVLVVEDEEEVRTVVARTLHVLGYDVMETESADAALELPDAALASLSVLVTDLVMPGMGGTDLAAALRVRLPDLPVLYISGYRDEAGDLDVSPESGQGFLAKPFTPGSLGFAVADLLGITESPTG